MLVPLDKTLRQRYKDYLRDFSPIGPGYVVVICPPSWHCQSLHYCYHHRRWMKHVTRLVRVAGLGNVVAADNSITIPSHKMEHFHNAIRYLLRMDQLATLLFAARRRKQPWYLRWLK